MASVGSVGGSTGLGVVRGRYGTGPVGSAGGTTMQVGSVKALALL